MACPMVLEESSTMMDPFTKGASITASLNAVKLSSLNLMALTIKEL